MRFLSHWRISAPKLSLASSPASPFLLNLLAPSLAPIFSRVFNSSLKNSCFPVSWCESSVLFFLHKKALATIPRIIEPFVLKTHLWNVLGLLWRNGFILGPKKTLCSLPASSVSAGISLPCRLTHFSTVLPSLGCSPTSARMLVLWTCRKPSIHKRHGRCCWMKAICV